MKYYNVERAAEVLDAEVEDVRRLAAEIGARLSGGRLRISEDELAVIERMLEDETGDDHSDADEAGDDDSDADEAGDDDSDADE